uniref:Uncharacterized protein n=1 Tax=Rhizophora mucronata TaxID=61149 RepID=A0A2P2IYF7_RHIMU
MPLISLIPQENILPTSLSLPDDNDFQFGLLVMQVLQQTSACPFFLLDK